MEEKVFGVKVSNLTQQNLQFGMYFEAWEILMGGGCLIDHIFIQTLVFFVFSPLGTTFTLFNNACQPPPFSLPPSGQALCLLLLFHRSSSPSSSSKPPFSSSLFSPTFNLALPVPGLLPAPHAQPPVSHLRVSQGWGSRDRTCGCPWWTRWPEGRWHPKGCCHPPTVLSWFTSSSSNQPQTDQLSEYRSHPGGQL